MQPENKAHDTKNAAAPRHKAGQAEIEARDLHLSFGSKNVLNGFSLAVERGQSLVILGRSGSGKSVFLKCLLGLLAPQKGALLWRGRDILHDPKRKRDLRTHIGMLFQSAALFDSLTVWENVAFGLMATGGIDRKQARERAIEQLTRVELPPETAELSPAELSGGMKKRVGLARAVATEPEILLFDEPTAGLDPIMTRIIDDLILNSVKTLGATAISVTHDMQSAARIADRVALLHSGRIHWQGSAADLAEPPDAALAQFVLGQARGPLAARTLAGEQD